jgi:hypothetical protein
MEKKKHRLTPHTRVVVVHVPATTEEKAHDWLR